MSRNRFGLPDECRPIPSLATLSPEQLAMRELLRYLVHEAYERGSHHSADARQGKFDAFDVIDAFLYDAQRQR